MALFRNVFVDPNERLLVPGAQKQSTLMSIAVGCFAAVGGFIYGYDTGLINSISEMEYVRQHFASNHSTFTAKETSIMTAILSLGTFFGALFAPLLSDNYGRRFAIIIATFVVFMIGNICQVASNSLVLFCIGRFITGVSIGIISAVVPVYQAEASPKFVRGAVIVTYQWAITWGLLVSSAVSQGTHANSTSASYRVPIGLQFLWSLILGVGMILLPESPRFYVRKDDINSAALSLSRLRRVPPNDPGLIEELIEIKASHDYESSFGSASLKDCFKSDPARPHQLKRLLTGIALQAIQQCSSINFIFYYGVNFFSRTGVNQSYLISFVTYAVNVVCTIPGIFLVETMGRRRLLIAGGIIMSASNLTIAIVGVTTNSVIANKIMIALVCLFISSFAASWGPVVWVVCGEIFSLGVRGKAVAFTAATNWLVNFVFAYITPYLVDTGKHTAALGTKIFFMWSAFNIIGTIVVYFIVYETKGLSLEQIDELYRSCPNARSSRGFKVKEFYDISNEDSASLSNHNGGDSEEKRDSVTNSSSLPESYVTGSDHFTQPSVPLHYQIEDSSDEFRRQQHNQPQDQSQPSVSQDLDPSPVDYHNFNPNYSVDLGYGLGLTSQLNRGPPSILTVSDEETIEEQSTGNYSGLNDYVSRLSSMNEASITSGVNSTPNPNNLLQNVSENMNIQQAGTSDNENINNGNNHNEGSNNENFNDVNETTNVRNIDNNERGNDNDSVSSSSTSTNSSLFDN